MPVQLEVAHELTDPDLPVFRHISSPSTAPTSTARPCAWFETTPAFVRYEWSERSAVTASVCHSPSQASRTTTRESSSPLARSTR